MKFYIEDGTELEFSPELSKSITVIGGSTEFEYNGNSYLAKPIEFKIDDIYFLMATIARDNPNKKIFIHHFEPLANDFFAMFFAVEV